jgi:hypothetical protein
MHEAFTHLRLAALAACSSTSSAAQVTIRTPLIWTPDIEQAQMPRGQHVSVAIHHTGQIDGVV